jgi:hypothetical protein
MFISFLNPFVSKKIQNSKMLNIFRLKMEENRAIRNYNRTGELLQGLINFYNQVIYKCNPDINNDIEGFSQIEIGRDDPYNYPILRTANFKEQLEIIRLFLKIIELGDNYDEGLTLDELSLVRRVNELNNLPWVYMFSTIDEMIYWLDGVLINCKIGG